MSLYIFPDATLLSSANTWVQTQTFSTTPVISATSSTEGGELQLAKPSGSTLSGNISIDYYANTFRVFENGGTARGFSVDLTTLAASSGSSIAFLDVTSTFTGTMTFANGVKLNSTTAVAGGYNNSGVQIQSHSLTAQNVGYTIGMWAATAAAGGAIEFIKSRSGTIGTGGAPIDGDTIGRIVASGYNSSPSIVRSAEVAFLVSGTPTATSVPTKIAFLTSDTTGTATSRVEVGPTGLLSALNGLTVTGVTQAVSSTGTASATALLQANSGSVSVGIIPKAAAGSYNGSVVANDSVIVVTDTTAGIGNNVLNIVPWSNNPSGIRMSTASSSTTINIQATTTTITGILSVTGQIQSSVTTGTAPFTVSSTTAVTNLNADLLDGYHVGTSGATIPILNAGNTFSGITTFSALVSTFGNNTGLATYGLGSGATLSGNTKTINIGTSGVAGSITNVNIGSINSNNTINIYGDILQDYDAPTTAGAPFAGVTHYLEPQAGVVLSSVTVNVSTAIFTCSAVTLVAGQAITLNGTNTGALITGYTNPTIYYVLSTNLTSTTFMLSTTPGGASITLTGTTGSTGLTFSTSTGATAFGIAESPFVSAQTYLAGGTVPYLWLSSGGKSSSFISVSTANNAYTWSFSNTGALVVPGQVQSSVTTGTAPFTVSSTTVVTNLNADLLDGNHATAFMSSGATTFAGDATDRADITTRVETGFYQYALGTTALGWPLNSSNWQHLLAVTHNNDSNYYSMQLAGSFFGSDLYQRMTNGSGTTAWNKIWTTGNDGSGSGLDADLFDGVDSVTFAASLRANHNISGGGTITVDASGYVLWSNRFIIISNGNGSNFGTSGYFDITCPTSGTITGVGGAANRTATTSGIQLGGWEALYYILPIGSVNTPLAANFRVAIYTAALDVPYNWVLVCLVNADNGRYYFNNGYSLKQSQSIDTAAYNSHTTYNSSLLAGYGIGSSGAAVPLLNGTNTFSGTATTFSNPVKLNSGTAVAGTYNSASVMLQSHANTPSIIGYTMGSWNTGNASAAIEFIKSRATGAGNLTVVQNLDNLGQIIATGVTSTPSLAESSAIRMTVSGTPSASSVPGKISFYTSNTSGASTSRVEINEQGVLNALYGTNSGYETYPSYKLNLDFGADVAGTWRRIIVASLINATYSTVGFRIRITDPVANHATTASVNANSETYFVACVRTNDITLDTPDSCYVRGPSTKIRAVKTSTGNYEIQVQNTIQYQEYLIEIDNYASNYNTHVVTYENGNTVGSTGTAQYTASVGTGTFFTENTATSSLKLLDTSSNYLTLVTNSTLTTARTVTLDFNNATRTIVFPGTTALTLVGTSQAQTLSNKTIAYGSNTLTDVAGTAVSNTFTANQSFITTAAASVITIGNTGTTGTTCTITGQNFAGIPWLAINTGTNNASFATITTGGGAPQQFTFNSDGSLGLQDSSQTAAISVQLAATSSVTLTANRKLTFDVADAARTIKLVGNLSIANNFTTAGNFALTLTSTAATNVTLPTTGTLATRAGTETLTNKTILGTATAISAATTLSAAQVQGGLIITSATPYNVTLPTGTTLDTITTTTDAWLELNFANAGASALTIVANTGVSTVGSLSVSAASGGRFILRRTSTAATWVAYRI